VHIHHIDRDRENNSKENLVLLCANCHYGLHHHLWDIGELNGNYNHPGRERIHVPYGPKKQTVPTQSPVVFKTKYATVPEYAAHNKVSLRTVRNEIKKGRIKAEKIGREYRIPVE
jgi:excisionase family DNA binding protein